MSLYKIEISHNMQPVLLLKNDDGKYIAAYSKRNPKKSAAVWKKKVKNLIEQNPGTLFIGLGISLFYEWPCRYLGKQLILLEPFMNEWRNIFRENTLLENKLKNNSRTRRLWLRIKALSEKNKPYIFSPDLDFKEIQKNFPESKKIVLLLNPPYERIYPEICSSIKEKFNAFSKLTFRQTINHFIKQWKRNWLKNLIFDEKIYTDKNIFFIQNNKNKINRPVLILGAGPSLNTNIQKIKALENLCFVITTDTALPFVLRENIRTDIVLSIDSGRGSFLHLWEVLKNIGKDIYTNKPESIPLLSWPGANSKLTSSYPGKVIYYLSSFPRDQFLENLQPVRDKKICSLNNPGGNILSAAMEFSFRFFSAEIFLFGVDLEKNTHTTHFKGSAYESFRLQKIHRLQSMENLNPPYKISPHFEKYIIHLQDDQKRRIRISGNKNFSEKYNIPLIDEEIFQTLKPIHNPDFQNLLFSSLSVKRNEILNLVINNPGKWKEYNAVF